MPDVPTPAVNGHGRLAVAPAVPQGPRSISSLEPAASTIGWLASIATAGSFCLFRGKGPAGLPVVTGAPVVAPNATLLKTRANSPISPATIASFLILKPPVARRARRRRLELPRGEDTQTWARHWTLTSRPHPCRGDGPYRGLVRRAPEKSAAEKPAAGGAGRLRRSAR